MNLKFRAYNKVDKMIYDVYSIEFLNGGIKAYGTGIHIGNGWVTEENGFTHDCDVILMQATGYKDDNGVDIYEGDMLEIVIGGYVQLSLYTVEDLESFICDMNPSDHYHAIGSMTIKGNIYES